MSSVQLRIRLLLWSGMWSIEEGAISITQHERDWQVPCEHSVDPPFLPLFLLGIFTPRIRQEAMVQAPHRERKEEEEEEEGATTKDADANLLSSSFPADSTPFLPKSRFSLLRSKGQKAKKSNPPLREKIEKVGKREQGQWWCVEEKG